MHECLGEYFDVLFLKEKMQIVKPEWMRSEFNRTVKDI